MFERTLEVAKAAGSGSSGGRSTPCPWCDTVSSMEAVTLVNELDPVAELVIATVVTPG
jgi:hypothetical protein